MSEPRAEFLTFHLTSVNRNPFIQHATGLFGGDIESGLSSYTIDDEQYRTSANYVTAVSAEGGTCQRAALAAWYLASQGTLNGPSSLGWTISHALWPNVQRENQCITLIEDGSVITTTVGPASTQTECQLDLGVTGPFPRPNRPFILRMSSPRQITYGPILAAEDGRTVVIQTNLASFVPPVPGQDLVYLGARNSHPVRTAAWHPPDVANQYVFGVDDVVPLAPSDAALSVRTTAVDLNEQRWRVCGANAVTAVCQLRATDRPTAIFTGLEYTWPFPDQAGTAYLLIPLGNPPDVPRASPLPPDGVYCVRAMVVNQPLLVVGGTMGDVTLADGDRVAQCVTSPHVHASVWRWNAATLSFAEVTAIPTPADHPLVLDRVGARAWWEGQSYTVLAAPHTTPTATRATMQSDTDALVLVDPSTVAATHVLIVLLCGDGGARVQPRSVLSSLCVPPVGWAWTYPVVLEPDGEDRFQAAALTDGLIGSVCVDSRCQTRAFFFYAKTVQM